VKIRIQRLLSLGNHKKKEMKSPFTTSTQTTATMMTFKSVMTMILLLTPSASTATMACRCVVEPTLDLALQDETVAIFHGTVVPSLSSTSTTTKEYSVWIEKVFQDGAVPLRAYQTITIVSSRNSCGVTLPLFSKYLFSGVVADKNDRTRLVQAEHDEINELPDVPTDTTATPSSTDTASKRGSKLRRTASTDATTGTSTTTTASVSMTVHLCNYFKPWRTVTLTEKCQLNNDPNVICN
jgi:hypothetical protein